MTRCHLHRMEEWSRAILRDFMDHSRITNRSAGFGVRSSSCELSVFRGAVGLLFRFLAFLGCALGWVGCGTPDVAHHVRNTSRSFTTVVLDAGHGAHDSGTWTRSRYYEKHAALDVVLRLNRKLRAAGFRTVLTRSSDVFIPLDQRAEISNDEHNAVFVSVHFNDAGRKPVRGVESYYFSAESAAMAKRMVQTLSRALDSPDRGARTARFRVIRMNENPAVLMECGYMSSRSEGALIQKPEYREKIAEGLFQGILQQRGVRRLSTGSMAQAQAAE